MDTTNEQWLPIPGFPDYDVSDLGRVRSRRRRSGTYLMTPALQGDGYPAVTLSGVSGAQSPHMVHILVMLTFVGSRHPKMVIHHKDANKQNNRLDNLEYVISRINARHAIAARYEKAANEVQKHLSYRPDLQAVLTRLFPELLRRWRTLRKKDRRATKRFGADLSGYCELRNFVGESRLKLLLNRELFQVEEGG